MPMRRGAAHARLSLQFSIISQNLATGSSTLSSLSFFSYMGSSLTRLASFFSPLIQYNELTKRESRFIRFDVDKLPAIAAKYKVTAMPTFFAIQSGKVVGDVRFLFFSSFPESNLC